jgi:hypothetical protein
MAERPGEIVLKETISGNHTIFVKRYVAVELRS